MIHPTALVDPGARIGADVSIGAYSLIGKDVEIGNGCRLGPHVIVEGRTRIGDNTQISQYASIGAPPQDFSYKKRRNRGLYRAACQDSGVCHRPSRHRSWARQDGYR